MNDDDFIKIVNENYERAKRERERLADEEYRKAYTRNIQAYERECILQKKKTVATFLKSVAAVLLVIGTIRVGIYLHSKNEPSFENPQPVKQTQIAETETLKEESIDFGFF